MIGRTLAIGAALLASGASAQTRVDMAARILPPAPETLGPTVTPFVSVADPRIALLNVTVIDGTGAPAVAAQTILIEGGRIRAVQPARAKVPAGFRSIDLTGHSVFPGIVGMHNHMYYVAAPNLTPDGKSEPPIMVPEMAFSSPRLYLAGGVTTMRTTGAVEPATDLNIKRDIDRGILPGPHMDVTGPYFEGDASPFIQMQSLKDADAARRAVDFWADQGVTSFKAYMNITRAELGATIAAAHARGIKVTGHLCSVTYPEAAALGIDNLEHGFFVNTQLDAGKTPDGCPRSGGDGTLAAMKAGGPEATALITTLVDAKVAVTSTLPVFEDYPGYAILSRKAIEVLSADARTDYLYRLARNAARKPEAVAADKALYANENALERQFVAAGGLLLAGPDPTGAGQVLPGFGDQRGIELLVGAGFSPVEAIRIATLNGATYLGLADRIGSIAPGKNADLVVVKGDPSVKIGDVENVVTVFKDGVGYDSAALLASVRGRYGRY